MQSVWPAQSVWPVQSVWKRQTHPRQLIPPLFQGSSVLATVLHQQLLTCRAQVDYMAASRNAALIILGWGIHAWCSDNPALIGVGDDQRNLLVGRTVCCSSDPLSKVMHTVLFAGVMTALAERVLCRHPGIGMKEEMTVGRGVGRIGLWGYHFAINQGNHRDARKFRGSPPTSPPARAQKLEVPLAARGHGLNLFAGPAGAGP
eukprot:gene11417-biopygen4441